MKNHRIYWEHVKAHSKRIVTISLFVGALVLSWNTAEADLLALADSNRDEYSALSAGVPSAGSPNGVIQLMHRTSLSDLQANASVPTFLHHPAPAFVNKNERGLAVKDDASLVVFSW